MTLHLLERARSAIEAAKRLVILTGAGISADSGIPTFRGERGLWKSYRPEQLANAQAFRRDPRKVWEWYGWRRGLISECEPNAGHEAIARRQRRDPSCALVTQNVDGFHALALERAEVADPASASQPEVLEMHGSIFRVRCTVCEECYEDRYPVDASSEETLPRCRNCDGLLRPDVVWFGESLDADILDRALTRASEADLCLVVGTSALVQPAAGIPLLTVRGGGAIIEVNPEPTPLTAAAAISLREGASAILPVLLGDP